MKKIVPNNNQYFSAQLIVDLMIFAISFFILIKIDIRNAHLSQIISVFFIIAGITAIPLCMFSKVINLIFLEKILRRYYRYLFLITVIIPLFALFFILNNNLAKHFYNNELWNIVFSYYYRLIIIYMIIFSLFIHFFSKQKINKKNIENIESRNKVLIIYLVLLTLLPLIVSQINTHSYLIKL